LRDSELRNAVLRLPYFVYNNSAKAFTYGGAYPGTLHAFGKADQFQQTTLWGGPRGGNTTCCATILK
jgi:hypothetical protein